MSSFFAADHTPSRAECRPRFGSRCAAQPSTPPTSEPMLAKAAIQVGIRPERDARAGILTCTNGRQAVQSGFNRRRQQQAAAASSRISVRTGRRSPWTFLGATTGRDRSCMTGRSLWVGAPQISAFARPPLDDRPPHRSSRHICDPTADLPARDCRRRSSPTAAGRLIPPSAAPRLTHLPRRSRAPPADLTEPRRACVARDAAIAAGTPSLERDPPKRRLPGHRFWGSERARSATQSRVLGRIAVAPETSADPGRSTHRTLPSVRYDERPCVKQYQTVRASTFRVASLGRAPALRQGHVQVTSSPVNRSPPGHVHQGLGPDSD